MRRDGRPHLAFLIALAMIWLGAPDGAAQDAASESDILHARVEQVRDDPAFTVRGVRIAARRVLPALYERRGFAPVWTDRGAREDLLRAIRDSAGDGLDPEDYLLSALERARADAEAAGASVDARIDYDLLLTEGLVRLLYHLIFGKVDPRSFDPHWNFTRSLHRGEPATFVDELIASGDVYGRIEREKPQHEMYTRLRAEYARQRELAARGALPPIAAGPTLKPGTSDARVTALRARLVASGDLAPGSDPASPAFDGALEAGVKAFQARHGLEADGAVGPATLAALNAPIEAELERIRVNLERGRWLLHDLEPTFVVVNVAGFEVYYLRDRKVVWSARAQVGKPYRQTPIFRSMLTYLVLNPTWTVPPTILANDILPAQRRDPSYLAKKRLRVIDHSGRVVPASSVDWSRASGRGFPYVLRQDPGPDNALGRVKFMFPNPYAVYLHDTPSRALFEKSERALSSGCIRVERPLELAALLIEGQQGWDRAAIDRAVAEGKTRSVSLAHPVPVLLSYWTAWVDGAGRLQLRADLYERDGKVAAGLAAPFTVRPREG
jgi:murein L,D-transpeptidase YcbB/YkuD